jgi:hypothetical protein
MDPNSENRIDNNYHKGFRPFIIAPVVYLTGNYFYHKLIFRSNQNKLQFTAFLVVNLFTSFEFGDILSSRSLTSYAA